MPGNTNGTPQFLEEPKLLAYGLGGCLHVLGFSFSLVHAGAMVCRY